ncbi:MAG: hypothetical protein HRT44_03785 [Bdellovibrionales bacterium]|nr:hypothetical protein [Bdellovibrionales bacterium]NQZ18365.1 hypothetical protein [Bdellovibrionales bacterium]
MFRLLMLISALFISSSAYGWSMNTSNEELIEMAETLGDEINDYDHEGEALKRSLFWLRNAKRILKGRHFRSRMRVPSEVSDAMLNKQLTKIVRRLERRRLGFAPKFYVSYILRHVLNQLKMNRIEDESIAILRTLPSSDLNFGPFAGGLVITENIRLINDGSGPAQIEGASFTNETFGFVGDTYPGSDSGCGEVLQPNDSCGLTLEFRVPLAPAVYTGEISILYFDGLSAQSLTKTLRGESLSND